jgi:thiol-disulfide isomerase/thioredoxin
MISVSALASMPILYRWIPLENAATPTDKMAMDKGKHHTLADFKGKVVVLNLWATWCGPCMEELPTLDKLEEELAAEGLVVIPLSLDEEMTYEDLRRTLDAKQIDLPHLAHDETGAFGKKLGGFGLPATLLIDRLGVLRYRYNGATDWTESDEQQKIRELLAEK